MPKLPLITEIINNLVALEPPIYKKVDPTNVTISAQAQLVVEPPFPEKLVQIKPVQTKE